MEAKLVNEGGLPKFQINGKIVSPLIYALSDTPLGHAENPWSKKAINEFHNAGIDLVGIVCDLQEDWHDDGSYYPASIIKEIKGVLAVNPSAKILIRLNVTPTYPWMRKHPEELIKYYGVECTDTGLGACVKSKDGTREIKASFFSEKWKKDVGDLFAVMKKGFVKEGVLDSVMAIQPAYGTCGEWHMYGKYHAGKDGYEADYSRPALEFFRAYLKKKYKTKERLSAAWGENVDFDTAELAPPAMRLEHVNFGEGVNYLLPEKSMRSLDSFKCYQLGAPVAISYYAKRIKKVFGEGMLVGSFYGYFFGCGDVYSRMLETEMLFKDKKVDFFASPSAYSANKYAGNYSMPRCLLESMRLNGKLFICEMDQGYESWSQYWGEKTKTYKCADEEEYSAILKRNVGEQLVHGTGAWFFDHLLPGDPYDFKVGYWDKPCRMQTVADIKKFADRLTEKKSFESVSDVLMVYDTESIYYLGSCEAQNTYMNFDLLNAVAKSGAGYDSIMLSDVKKVDLEKYKCVVFVYCAYLSKTDYNFIKKTVMKNGRTVGFIGGSGFIIGNKSGAENTKKLLGKSGAEAFYSKRKEYSIFYAPHYVTDPDYFRKIFKRAGAHIYTEGGEVVATGNGMVMIHEKGVKTTKLNLPSGIVKIKNPECATYVFDVKTGEKVL